MVSIEIILNNLDPPPKKKIGAFSVLLQFVAVAQISRLNCDEMDGDRPKQPANRNCCRASHELCSNYLFSKLENELLFSGCDE